MSIGENRDRWQLEQAMAARINELMNEIRGLEDQLEDALRAQQERVLYRLEGTRVLFEQSVEQAHRKLRVGLLRWLRDSSLRNIVSAPFIYAMVVPFLLLDLAIWAYQAICFPLYRIPRVRRSRYIVIDRHRLSYLNSIEKLNCVYCGYANGLMSYVREVVARTEQYWCPVKHARKVLDPHRRYARFADFGDSEGYQVHLQRMRAELAAERR
jgi:hypothetical protein